MALHITPEIEAKLNELAHRTHREADELLEEAVNYLLLYNEWLVRKVSGSMTAVSLGHVVPDADVQAWLEQRERC